MNQNAAAKRVLDVGNCGVDYGAISSMMRNTFGAEVVQAHGPDDAHALLGREHFLPASKRLQFRYGGSSIQLEQRGSGCHERTVLGNNPRNDAAFEVLHGGNGA